MDVRFDFVDDGRVLERRTIGGEIDRLRRGRELGDAAAGIVVAFLEGEESGGGLAFEAEGGGDFVPVEFRGGGALEGWKGV